MIFVQPSKYAHACNIHMRRIEIIYGQLMNGFDCVCSNQLEDIKQICNKQILAQVLHHEHRTHLQVLKHQMSAYITRTEINNTARSHWPCVCRQYRHLKQARPSAFNGHTFIKSCAHKAKLTVTHTWARWGCA